VTNVRETARLLVENGTKVAPVTHQGEFWGSITAVGILEAVLDDLSVLSVCDIHTSNVITITKEDTLGDAINSLREHGISQLPVVDENGTLTGIMTTEDLAEFVVYELSGTPRGVQVRLRGDQETLAGTGEGYGANDALSIALDKLERNVIELKRKRSDEQYRGESLRKLNEL
jgi:CBS domain containing-hemolysin-like protein